ncbi:MAG: hypothetical protein GSR77_05805 [Desulfurococcales archaeon]|nr:hypothetical protein [Desulfurococcales archaeon]
MVKEEIILRLNRVLNANGLKSSFKQEELHKYMKDTDIDKALRSEILKESIHLRYQINYDNYFMELLSILGLRNSIYDGVVDVGLRSASLAVDNYIQIKLYLASIISSSIIDNILYENNYIVPLLLTSKVEAEKFRSSECKEYENLRVYLSRGVIRNIQILSLFVPILPLPESSNDLKYYKEALRKIGTFLNEISTRIDSNLDEESFIVNYRDTVIAKTLLSFLYLYKNLYYAVTAGFRDKPRKPDYWFEHILKTLLTKFLVEHKFPKEVANYLYEKYRVGGKCKEDITIPVIHSNKLGVMIVDAKLWIDDVCKEIKNNTERLLCNPEIIKQYECGKKQEKPKESLMKYLWYINRKSKKLLELENILASTLGKKVSFYCLLIVQPEEPDNMCRHTLMEYQEELIRIRDNDFKNMYSDIAVISLNTLFQRLSSNFQEGLSCSFNNS